MNGLEIFGMTTDEAVRRFEQLQHEWFVLAEPGKASLRLACAIAFFGLMLERYDRVEQMMPRFFELGLDPQGFEGNFTLRMLLAWHADSMDMPDRYIRLEWATNELMELVRHNPDYPGREWAEIQLIQLLFHIGDLRPRHADFWHFQAVGMIDRRYLALKTLYEPILEAFRVHADAIKKEMVTSIYDEKGWFLESVAPHLQRHPARSLLDEQALLSALRILGEVALSDYHKAILKGQGAIRGKSNSDARKMWEIITGCSSIPTIFQTPERSAMAYLAYGKTLYGGNAYLRCLGSDDVDWVYGEAIRHFEKSMALVRRERNPGLHLTATVHRIMAEVLSPSFKMAEQRNEANIIRRLREMLLDLLNMLRVEDGLMRGSNIGCMDFPIAGILTIYLMNKLHALTGDPRYQNGMIVAIRLVPIVDPDNPLTRAVFGFYGTAGENHTYKAIMTLLKREMPPSLMDHLRKRAMETGGEPTWWDVDLRP